MSTNRASSRKRKSSSANGAVQSKNAADPTSAAAVTPVQQKEMIGPDATGWEKNYDYVFADLRKLLIVSLSLFAIIIVAGFFL
jgi:hypothetical protein